MLVVMLYQAKPPWEYLAKSSDGLDSRVEQPGGTIGEGPAFAAICCGWVMIGNRPGFWELVEVPLGVSAIGVPIIWLRVVWREGRL